MSNEEFDKNGNLIYWKNSDGSEYWNKFDENHNSIYTKFSSGREIWRKFDKNNFCIHYKDSFGYEDWRKYDERGNLILITQQEFKQIENIKVRKELYLNIKRSNRFELIDI